MIVNLKNNIIAHGNQFYLLYVFAPVTFDEIWCLVCIVNRFAVKFIEKIDEYITAEIE